ncbi:MAG TPA: 4-hydroxy-tetrahydrodipicolinate reductase [Rhodanobacteraceae bacterium]|nr:4-hydroxy-tetrahydrodipicolinate reductase [Rhodanobacteraceae bacterium]
MPATPLRLVVNGASGRMGRAVLDRARADARWQVAAGIVSAGSALEGQPIGGIEAPGAARYGTRFPVLDAVAVVIDFSTPAGLAAALDACLQARVPLVTGTTGLDATLEARLDAAAATIPLLRAANFSLGVALLTRLLRSAAAALPDWDLEILEAHHARKQDAPSGTALALGQAAAAARGVALADVAAISRTNSPGARRAGSIGFASIRAGDIVGEHTALLAGPGERLELTHRADDRAIFARGALSAAAWLAGRAPGSYALEAVFDAAP